MGTPVTFTYLGRRSHRVVFFWGWKYFTYLNNLLLKINNMNWLIFPQQHINNKTVTIVASYTLVSLHFIVSCCALVLKVVEYNSISVILVIVYAVRCMVLLPSMPYSLRMRYSAFYRETIV